MIRRTGRTTHHIRNILLIECIIALAVRLCRHSRSLWVCVVVVVVRVRENFVSVLLLGSGAQNFSQSCKQVGRKSNRYL